MTDPQVTSYTAPPSWFPKHYDQTSNVQVPLPAVGTTVQLTRGDYIGRKATVEAYIEKNGQPLVRVKIVYAKGTAYYYRSLTNPKIIDVQTLSVMPANCIPKNLTRPWQSTYVAPAEAIDERTVPILGYRHFMLADDGTLQSWYKSNFHWLPGQPTKAECDEGLRAPCKHHRGGYGHGCGLYALVNLDAVASSYYQANKEGEVLAAVAMWGKVQVGSTAGVEKGFRAEYGQVVALLCDNYRKAETVHAIAERYGCPVTHNRDRFANTDWVAEHNARVELEDMHAELDEQDDPLANIDDPTEESEGTEEDGHGQGGEGDPGDALEAAVEGAFAIAACRAAAAGAGTVQHLRHLYQEGTISLSNIQEVVEEV
jgi:hypothetical protein